MTSVRQTHVVPGLPATVEANDRVSTQFASQIVGIEPLAAVAEAEADDGDDPRVAHRIKQTYAVLYAAGRAL